MSEIPTYPNECKPHSWIDGGACPLCERDRFKTALTRINEIRNSIVGMQGFNFSEHAYPLVAALNEAGFVGLPYPEARANLGTLIERATKAEAEVERLREALEWYATVPRDDEGATMPLDTGERAREALRKTGASPPLCDGKEKG